MPQTRAGGAFLTDLKQQLLQWVESDRERLIAFLQEFIRCRNPNPPGDTLSGAAFVRRFLDEAGLPYKVVAPKVQMPNLIATTECGQPGRHLVLNGHIDVFPVGPESGWTQDPWGGALVDGRIYGRGACDMKCGTTASIFTYAYLNRIRDRLKGRLTLTVVSDEETFGEWGTRYLMEHNREEVLGDCCLNGEPSSPYTVRFGEKGMLWMTFRVSTPGGHGAYPHLAPNAIEIAAEVMGELKALRRTPVREDPGLAAALDESADAIDEALGKGAARVVREVTVNFGVIRGGAKVNMIAADCAFEVDIRIPNGVSREAVIAEAVRIASRHPEVTCEVMGGNEPNWRAPEHEMMEHVRENARLLSNKVPAKVISLGGTDARLWRMRGVPAVVYGPSPTGMGGVDEHVTVDEFMHVVKSHLLSAYDYLSTAG
jgi:succinyl-diaminopimelate desuccinylase